MATAEATCRQFPVSFSSQTTSKTTEILIKETIDNAKGDRDTPPGAQLSERAAFRARGGREVTVSPVVVEFRRLLQSKNSAEVVPGIANCDLLHAVVGLYDVSLSDMTPEVLYATVCENWARTILLVKDIKDTLEETELRKKAKLAKHGEGSSQKEEVKGCTTSKDEDTSHSVPNSDVTAGEGAHSDKKGEDTSHSEPNSDITAGEGAHSDKKGEDTSHSEPNSDITAGEGAHSDKKGEDTSHSEPNSDVTAGEGADSDRKGEDTSHSEPNSNVTAGEGADSDKKDVDILEPEEEKPGRFDDVFSDTDEELEDGDDDSEEDFSTGIKTFLASVVARREAREKHKGPLQPDHIGVENRLVAATTFKKVYCSKPSEKVIHLTLLAVRLRFRKWGIGKYLLQQVKDPQVAGQYDAVVVHADNEAVDFFQRYGFTDDTVLNNKWSELAEQFTNCTLMCYLPPFTGQTILSESLPELDIIAMEREIKKWRLKAQEAYVSEVSCMNRMRHEIIHLRALVSSQQDLITKLVSDNESLRKEKFLIEREFLEYRLNAVKLPFSQSDEMDEDEELNTERLMKDLEEEVARTARQRSRFLVSHGPSNEPYCHGRDTEGFYLIQQEFTDSMKRDVTIVNQHQVKMVTKAMLPPSVEEQYTTCIGLLKEPSMVTRLYYCGGLEQPNNISNILRNGFTENDFSFGEYGRGLYFSKFPSKAAQFSAFGRLIVAEVGLGQTQTVMKKDRTRSMADSGNDSIITPGRLVSSEKGDSDSMLCQEYIIFNVHQAKPLYLIEYATKST